MSDTDAVRLMSIHAAKGLEFPVVCVADLGRTPNTRMPELLVEGERVGLQLAHLDGTKSTPALEYEALCDERRAEEAVEEDRIVYVAMTRARERLLLSGALELSPRPCESANPTIISWLAPALVGDLGELAQAPSGERLRGIVREAVAGGEPVRCLLATAEDAAALLSPISASPTAAPVPDPDTGLDAPPPAPGAPAEAPAPCVRRKGAHTPPTADARGRRAGAGEYRGRAGRRRRRRAPRAGRRLRRPRPGSRRSATPR